MSEELTYQAAITELETILSELETSAIDVDQLSTRLARATELVRFCRDRLTVVQTDVDDALKDLGEPASATAQGSSTDA